MITLIFGLILILLGLALYFFFSRPVKVDDTYTHPRVIHPVIPIGVAILGIIAIVLSCLTIIQAKNEGVVTRFGKPITSLGPGLHFKAPWDKVVELDGTIQNDEYAGDDAIYVRIGDGTTAEVTTTIRWRIIGEKADELYASYRSDDVNQNIRKALVSTVFKASVNQVLGEYNPTENIKVIDPKKPANASFSPDYDAIADQVFRSMEDRVSASGDLVKIESVTISYLKLSDVTQKKINDFQAEVANTQVALQREATASAQASANKALSNSVSNDPNVLVSKCMDTLTAMVEAGQQVPAGFTCWPGGSSALVVPATK